jgi:transposase
MMSFKEEEERLQSQAAIALQGKVLVAGQLRSVVAQKMGHAVWDDSLWDLLHRHGWSKKAPRPQHPKADEQVKEQRKAFKKKHPNASAQKAQKQRP